MSVKRSPRSDKVKKEPTSNNNNTTGTMTDQFFLVHGKGTRLKEKKKKDPSCLLSFKSLVFCACVCVRVSVFFSDQRKITTTTIEREGTLLCTLCYLSHTTMEQVTDNEGCVSEVAFSCSRHSLQTRRRRGRGLIQAPLLHSERGARGEGRPSLSAFFLLVLVF